MSSPKRATRSVAKKAAGKSARPRPAPLRVVEPAAAAAGGASAEAERIAAVLEQVLVDGKLDTVSAGALQKLIAAACRLYRARREDGEDFWPVPRNSLTATDVMVTASGLLKSADLAVFELGMWQNWTGR